LGGTTTATTNASGVASFTNLQITGSGGHTLGFTSGTLTPATSNTIDVNSAETQLFIATQPSATATSGVAFAQQPTIQLRDVSGNNVSKAGVVITASIASGGGTLGGTLTASTNASGVASFTNLQITGSGGHTLSFTSGTLTPDTSTTISVSLAGDSYEPDNDAAHATLLSTGVPSPNHSIHQATDLDWFRFTINVPSAVRLETSGSSGDTELRLYDGSLNQIDYSDDEGIGAFSLINRTCGNNQLAAGTYYARVESFQQGSTIGTYSIQVNITACQTAYLRAVFASGGIFVTTNVGRWVARPFYIVYSDPLGQHPIESPSWNRCSGDIQVLEPDGTDDRQSFFFSERNVPNDLGLDIDPSTTSVTINMTAVYESFDAANPMGGFWKSTDAPGSVRDYFGVWGLDCRAVSRNIPSSLLYFDHPIEINIGYDDTNTGVLGDFAGGIREVTLTFNGWLVPAGQAATVWQSVPIQ
jgi:hypothetical protein